jgi:hypothetical protein
VLTESIISNPVGKLEFIAFQVCPPSALLKVTWSDWLGPDVPVYKMLEFLGSTVKAMILFVNPVAVQLAPPSVLLDRPAPKRIAYNVDGLIGSMTSIE